MRPQCLGNRATPQDASPDLAAHPGEVRAEGVIPVRRITLPRHPKAWLWDPRVSLRRAERIRANSWMPRPSLGMTTEWVAGVVRVPARDARIKSGHDAVGSVARQVHPPE